MHSNPYSKNWNFFYFKLSFSKFARDSQNTQTQTQNSNFFCVEQIQNLILYILV